MAEAIALASLQESEPQAETESESESDDGTEPPANKGKLIADATCAPAALCH